MQDVLFDYRLNPTTWAYLSSLMTIGIFFKFRRFWSVRNLDLVALIAFAPGLLLLYHGLKKQQLVGAEQIGYTLEQLGYIWLFSVGGFFLIRLLLDAIVVRRPLLEPNLSASGLTFTGVAMLVFLMANVVTTERSERLEDVLPRAPVPHGPGYPYGPGHPYFYYFASFSDAATIHLDSTQPQPEARAEAGTLTLDREAAPQIDNAQPDSSRRARLQTATTRTIVILAHLAVTIGVVLIGYRHFDNAHTGVAVASLYLLVFYTSQMVGRVGHVVPAALLVWAVAAYRRPVVAGVLIGLAAGLIYYPLFLLPLWCGFYWRRGLIRFAVGVIVALALLAALLLFSPADLGSFNLQLQQMFGWMNPLRADLDLAGFWGYHDDVFRIPVLAAFVALCASLALWPAQKNLGTLLSCSAAVMLGTQFWHAYQGGIYVAWYLPLLLLTIFRPNLEDRVALSTLSEVRGWWRKRRPARAEKTA